MYDQLFPDVFIASVDGVQWQSRAIVGGSIIDFVDGPKCTSDSDPSALIELGPDDFVLLRVRTDGVADYYVKIGGGSLPPAQAQYTGLYANPMGVWSIDWQRLRGD